MKIRKYIKTEAMDFCYEMTYLKVLDVKLLFERDFDEKDIGKALWNYMSEDMYTVYLDDSSRNIRLLMERDTDFSLDYEPVVSWGGYSFEHHDSNDLTRGTKYTVMYAVFE